MGYDEGSDWSLLLIPLGIILFVLILAAFFMSVLVDAVRLVAVLPRVVRLAWRMMCRRSMVRHWMELAAEYL